VPAEAIDDLLAVSVVGARVSRLNAELALARRERRESIDRALAAGASQAQIARRLGLNRRTVWSILRTSY
jgi:DNA-binding CsgD family transcriptional regulator